jgi:hypothetical protein
MEYTSNNLTQLALMYDNIERVLRIAAKLCTPISISAIRNNNLILGTETNNSQVHNIIEHLVVKGFVRSFRVQNETTTFSWDLNSPSFTFSKHIQKMASKRPSKVTNVKPDSAVIQQVAKLAQEIEVQLGGVTVVISRNPKTNRLCITVEEI